MADENVTRKSDLLAHIERDWTAINKLLDGLTESQLTDIRNPDGWSIKDHIAHLTAWENSSVYFLQHKPRYEGLGIAEEIYLNDDLDEINDTILRLHKDESLQEVRERFEAVHTQLMTLLEPLTDEDLAKPYAYYLPDDAAEDGGPRAMRVVYGNTTYHYREHQAWIEEMLT